MTQETGLTTIQNRAREKVRTAFAEVFTDQELDAMLKKEIENFFHKPSGSITITERRHKHVHGSNTEMWVTDATDTKCSPFQLIVWEYCSKVVKQHLYQVMDQPELEAVDQTEWVQDPADPNGIGFPLTKTYMGEVIAQKAQELVDANINNMFQQMFAGYLTQAKADMRMEFERRFSENSQY